MNLRHHFSYYLFSEGKTCTKGKSCKSTCISRADKCLEDFLPVIGSNLDKLASRIGAKSTEEVVQALGSAFESLDATQIKSFEEFGKAVAAGEVTEAEQEQVAKLLMSVSIAPKQSSRSDPRVMSYDEVVKIDESGRLEKLEKAYKASIVNGKFDPDAPGGMGDYVRQNVNVIEISDKTAALAYGMLPATARAAINKAGSVKGEGQVYAGRDENGNPKFAAAGNKERGVMLTKKWLEQDGKDPFTGEYIDIRKAEPEHLFSWSQAKATGGKGDIDTNLAWASPATNNSKAMKGIDDDFGKWAQQIKEWKDMGREAYERDIVAPKLESASKAKGLAGAAPTELGKALAATTPQERIDMMRASIKAYGDRVRYLVRASGMESGEWGEAIPGKRGLRRQPFDARVMVDVGGKKIKPSEALLVAMAALEGPAREKLIKEVDQLRLKRAMTQAEADKFEGPKDPGYVQARTQLDERFQRALTDTITSAVPNMAEFL